jgi:hypothetical protein
MNIYCRDMFRHSAIVLALYLMRSLARSDVGHHVIKLLGMMCKKRMEVLGKLLFVLMTVTLC